MVDSLALHDIASLLAREAGALVKRGRAEAHVTTTKSSHIDIVTQMDTAAEQLLRTRLASLRPDDSILGEEGSDVHGTSDVTWVIDPIDGTVNYLYGLPHYAVSVAAVTGGADPTTWTAQAGAVCDGSGVLWSAARGHGAWREGVRLNRDSSAPLDATLLATGFQYIAERRTAQGRIVAAMLGSVRDIRRLGAASVDLCLVAAGEIDAYYEHGLKPWDHAAGALIAAEAGVKVAGIDGGPADEHLLIAAMPETWDELRDALVEAGARSPWPVKSA